MIHMKKIIIVLLFVCIKINASIVVMDADSGRVLYEENKDKIMLIASTTKIMTSIIALENASLNDKYVVGNEIKEVYGSMIYAKDGQTMSLQDLLYGLILRSGNDAAMIISNNVMPYNDFIENMNMKAYKLKMYNTTFENPHGLNDSTKNYSTAYDMALLMKYAINNPQFMKISSASKYNYDNTTWYNKNELLINYKYAKSGKIGYTKKSGPVFVSFASKNGKNLIIVSINEEDKFNLHKKLYEKYFNAYEKYPILNKYTFSFKTNDISKNYYYIKHNFNMLLNDNEKKLLEIKIELFTREINGIGGYVNIFINGKLIHKENIYIKEYEKRKSSIKDILLFWKK